jgi:hypothetical protein
MNKFKLTLLKASLAFATAFTFSCSSDDGDGGDSDNAAMQEVKKAFETWYKLQAAYFIETWEVEDCSKISYRLPESSNFSYECDVNGIANLNATSKKQIKDCPVGNGFIITAAVADHVSFAVSVSPENACDFFKETAESWQFN